MSEPGKLVAISNTGPLISAFQCRRVDLLAQYFSVIHITPAERAELDRHGWTAELEVQIHRGLIAMVEPLQRRETVEAQEIARRIAADPASQDPEWRNHYPEAEAVVIMLRRHELLIDQILLDEKAARAVAVEMGLSVTGFPGILGRAGLDGLLTQDGIRQLLRTCRRQGTHYSDRLIETVAQSYGR